MHIFNLNKYKDTIFVSKAGINYFSVFYIHNNDKKRCKLLFF